jgi:hypothetical protein
VLRFLVLLLLALLVWRATMLLLQRVGLGSGRQVGSRRGGAAGGEELVRCAVCGTRVPASRALPADDAGPVCSEACRGRAAGGGGG